MEQWPQRPEIVGGGLTGLLREHACGIGVFAVDALYER